MNTQYSFYTFLFILFFSACSSGSENSEDVAALPASQQGKLVLNQEQVALAAIKTGKLEYRLISPSVSCTGEIDIMPQNMASVSAPMGGYIQKTSVTIGKYVKKGQNLAVLTNPDYITLQQEYLGALSELRFAEKDFERQQILGEQNATAEKKLQQSEALYHSLQSNVAGLKARLQILGFHLTELEKGNVQSTVNLRAPISGYVTGINHHLGQFAESREVVFEIMNQDNMHLELNVFEQDISKIATGQPLVFKPVGGDKTYRGKVSLINPKRNGEERTFTVHAHIDHQGKGLMPGMFVDADISIDSDTLPSLPEKAIVYQGNKPFVVTETNGSYNLQNVETGQKVNGWIEIKNAEQLNNKNIVKEGASRIFAALQRE